MPTDLLPIHRRLAEESTARLAAVHARPQRILLFGADGDHSRRLLAERYPQAAFCEYDHRQEALAAAAAARKTGWWKRLGRPAVTQYCQAADAPLPAASADMLWANLGLPPAADPVTVFDRWSYALKNDGMLFFTHWGRDTLAEVAALLNTHGLNARIDLPDMHDLGDMLFHHGFYDPVMDTARLCLEYRRPEPFWQDMADLGLWQAVRCNDDNAARVIVNNALLSGSLNTVGLETVYGHALRRPVLPPGEQPVSFRRKS